MEIRLVLIVALCSSAATIITCSSAGLHMELIHVDGKGNYTVAERVQRAMASSRQRLTSFVDVSAPVHWNTSQYIAEYLIGNPPQRAEALIDTGSDLIWTQCSTCSLKGSCVMQGLPYYNASKSDSFHPVPCNDTLCLANRAHSCRQDGSCAFGAFYGVGDARGSIGTEVFAFEHGSVTLTFGCVDTLQFTPGSLDGSSGLIGLGRGPLSLVSQIGASKFSYCHTPYLRSNVTPGARSHLFVGASASLSGGSPVMSMSFVQGPKKYPFYYVPLIGISVGQTRLSIPPMMFALKPNGTGGGVFVDSGNPTSVLVDGAYRPLREELRRQLNGSLLPPPAGSGIDLCVAVAQEKAVPSMVFHFSGGADMVLPPENYWVPLDDSISCMVMHKSSSVSIIGNFQLQNMHLLYDLTKEELSFQTADCSLL
ncbi:aspartic proteinase nepenthesin-1-like [Triticum dicoccoides]|uniref:aspartic proteinase nepenthesin-1-like n=1 Tax=Triticum dicoccoides TaxID=85692 RepID=UPI00188E7370|nr:aspartic proteinase nepenthesin-1-like [Triticum dicoccoides]